MHTVDEDSMRSHVLWRSGEGHWMSIAENLGNSLSAPSREFSMHWIHQGLSTIRYAMTC